MSEFWDFVNDLIEEAEKKKFGRDIYKWIAQNAKSQEDVIDLDEKMAKRFGISELNAGKIIQIYVKHKAGKFDEKTAIKQIDAVK